MSEVPVTPDDALSSGSSDDPRIPLGKWSMNEYQRATLLEVYAEYPAPWGVGWRGDHWPEAPFVRGSLFRSVDDDENGIRAGEFTIYRDGSITWWTRPPEEDHG